MAILDIGWVLRRLAARGSHRCLLEMLNFKPDPALLNKNLHFDEIPNDVHTE